MRLELPGRHIIDNCGQRLTTRSMETASPSTPRSRRNRGPLSRTAVVLLLFLSLQLLGCVHFVGADTQSTQCACKASHRARVHLLLDRDPSTSEVYYGYQQGALEAAKRVKVSVNVHFVSDSERRDKYSDDPAKVIQSFLTSLNDTTNYPTDTHFILTTGPAGTEANILSMRQKGYRVVTLGGVSSIGNLADIHVGQNETKGGELVADEIMKAGSGAQRVLCVLDAERYVEQKQRCDNLGVSLLQRCAAANVTNCQYARSSLAAIESSRDVLLSQISTNQTSANFDWVISAGKQSLSLLSPIMATMRAENRPFVRMAAYDLDSRAATALTTGSVQFVVDQQQYLQGFVGYVVLVEFGLRVQLASQPILAAGPKIVRALETPSRPNEETVRLATVLHGGRQWSFWTSVMDGVTRGVGQTSFAFSDCTTVNQNCSETDQFRFFFAADTTNSASQDEILRSLESRDNGKVPVDGLISSIPDAQAMKGSLVSIAREQTPFFAINAGYGTVTDFDFWYMGMFDVEGAKTAAGRLKTNGGTKAICLYVGNLGFTKDRCEYFAFGFDNNITTRIYPGPDDSAQMQLALQTIVLPDPALNVIFVCCSGLYASVRKFLVDNHLDTRIKIGSFDVTDTILDSITNGELEFTVDQQQNYYGYLPVHLVRLQALTGQALVDRLVLSGPRFVDRSNAQLIKCSMAPECVDWTNQTLVRCMKSEWIGDGWCDPENNYPECNYDGGDCCQGTCKDGPFFKCNSDHFSSRMNRYQCAIEQCDPGQQPTGQGTCVDCQVGSFGVDGKSCITCSQLGSQIRCMGQTELHTLSGYWMDREVVKHQLLKASDRGTLELESNAILSNNIYECSKTYCVGSRGANESASLGTVSGCAGPYSGNSYLCMGCADGFVKIGQECQVPNVCTAAGGQGRAMTMALGLLCVILGCVLVLFREYTSMGIFTCIIYFLQAQFGLAQRSPTGKFPIFAILEIWNNNVQPFTALRINDKGAEVVYNCGFYGYGDIYDHIGFDLAMLFAGLALVLVMCLLYRFVLLTTGIRDTKDIRLRLFSGGAHGGERSYYNLDSTTSGSSVGISPQQQYKGGLGGISSQQTTAFPGVQLGMVEGFVGKRQYMRLRYWRIKTWQVLLGFSVHILLFPVLRYALQLVMTDSVSDDCVLLADASVLCSSSEFHSHKLLGYFLLTLAAVVLMYWIGVNITWQRCLDLSSSSARRSSTTASSSSGASVRRPYITFLGTKVDKIQFRGLYNCMFGFYKTGHEHFAILKLVQNVALALILESVRRKLVLSMLTWVLFLISLITQLRYKPFIHATDNLVEEVLMICHFFISSFYILGSLTLAPSDWANVSMGFILLLLVLFSGLDLNGKDQQRDHQAYLTQILRIVQRGKREAAQQGGSDGPAIKLPATRPPLKDCSPELKSKVIRNLWRKAFRAARMQTRRAASSGSRPLL